MRDSFAFKFKGVLIEGAADVDHHSKLLIPDSIQLSENTRKILDSTKDEKEYWDQIDELCIAMDKTGIFADEVFSIHVTD